MIAVRQKVVLAGERPVFVKVRVTITKTCFVDPSINPIGRIGFSFVSFGPDIITMADRGLCHLNTSICKVRQCYNNVSESGVALSQNDGYQVEKVIITYHKYFFKITLALKWNKRLCQYL